MVIRSYFCNWEKIPLTIEAPMQLYFNIYARGKKLLCRQNKIFTTWNEFELIYYKYSRFIYIFRYDRYLQI